MGYKPLNQAFVLPDGWNTTWLAAKAAGAANLMFIGDSITQGGHSSNGMTKGIMPLVRNGLAGAGYATAAEFYNMFGFQPLNYAGVGGTPPWSALAQTGTQVDYGLGRGYQFASTAASSYVTFTSPSNCTDMDLVYTVNGNGQFGYKVDSGTQVNVKTSAAALAANSTNLIIPVATGLTAGIHTLDVGWQTVGGSVYIQGVICYPNGRAAAGIKYAYLPYSGAKLADYALGGPANRFTLLAGQVPNGPSYATPTGAPTVAVQALAGNVDIGTHFYKVSLIGAVGETGLGPASAVATASSGNQQVNLTAIPTDPGNVAGRRAIYRTKAGAASTGPYFLLTTIFDNTTTTFTDNVADASLGLGNPAWSNGGPTNNDVYPASPGQTGFGFPTQPHLCIMAMGLNDCAGGGAADTYLTSLQQLIQALRRGQSNTSILIMSVSFPHPVYSDCVPAQSNYNNWALFTSRMTQLAAAFGCGYFSVDARWGSTPFTKGFVTNNDLHPIDAGSADIANALLSVL